MTPYLLLGAAVAAAGAYYVGRMDGQALARAVEDRERAVAAVATEAAASAAAGAISKIRVRNTTVRQEVEREIRENVVYRDCVHGPGSLQHINAALTGERAQPAGGGKLPPADAADRADIRRNDDQADRGGRPVP